MDSRYASEIIGSIVFTFIAFSLVLAYRVLLYGMRNQPLTLAVECTWWVLSIASVWKFARRDPLSAFDQTHTWPTRLLRAAIAAYAFEPVIYFTYGAQMKDPRLLTYLANGAGAIAVALYWFRFAQIASRLRTNKTMVFAAMPAVFCLISIFASVGAPTVWLFTPNFIMIPVVQFGVPMFSMELLYYLVRGYSFTSAQLVESFGIIAVGSHVWIFVRLIRMRRIIRSCD